MKPLMNRQSSLPGQWPAVAWLVGTSLLAACVVSTVWAEPVGNNNFSTLIRNNPSGHFELKENVYLNGSPWTPLPSFNGILDGSEYAIYDLNIEENRTNANSGLFCDQNGVVKDLIFINPQLMARGDGVHLGLVAGDNSGNVTGVFWQGGWMENAGNRTSSPFYRYPLLGVVGQNSAGGQVKARAQGVNQIATGNSASIGIGAGSNAGIAQAVAQSVNQTVTGNGAYIGIGAGTNSGESGTTQAVAQFVNQAVTGNNASIGIGAGFNRGTARAVAQSVNQAITGNLANIGIGAGNNMGTTQAVAQFVNQTITGDHACIGIGAGINWNITQAVAQAVTRTVTGDHVRIGIGAGYNDGTTQEGWMTGNTNQYPMLVDLNGGFQDMRRISPKFMEDFALPSNNPNASWFSPEIRTILKNLSASCSDLDCLFTVPSHGVIRHLLYDGQRYHGFVRTYDNLTYWAVYGRDAYRVSRESCCDLYGFTDLNERGVVVDAVANEDNVFYVAYHERDQNGSMLARYETLDFESQLQTSMVPLPARPVELFIHDEVLYLVSTDQVVEVDGATVFSAMGGETIHSARIVGKTLYVLLDAADGGQVRAISLASGEPDTAFTLIPVSVTGDQIVTLRGGNGKIHLLVQEGNQIHWLKYSLQGEKDSESLATLPGRVTLSYLDLMLDRIPGTEAFQEYIIAMGATSNNQPGWSAISFKTVKPSGLSAIEIIQPLLSAGVLLTTIALFARICCLMYCPGEAVRE